MAEELKDDKQISTARACRIIGLERSGYYYQSIKDDTEVERRLLYYAPATARLHRVVSIEI